MGTPNFTNMSFDSPITVAKTPTETALGGQKKDCDDSTRVKTTMSDNVGDSIETKESKHDEDKTRSKKKDMFAPEADMFAEEYSVSSIWLLLLLTFVYSVLSKDETCCRLWSNRWSMK